MISIGVLIKISKTSKPLTTSKAGWPSRQQKETKQMEIISKTVEIEANLPVDTRFIEQTLEKMGIVPLRWAIVNCCTQKTNKCVLTISLACESL